MTTITIDWADVTALAPELSAVSVAGQDEILAQVAVEVLVSRWGLTMANTLATWLARHIGTINGSGVAGGPVTGVSVGQVRTSYAAPSTDTSSLQQTRYGKEYLRLARNAMGGSALVAGGNGAIAGDGTNGGFLIG